MDVQIIQKYNPAFRWIGCEMGGRFTIWDYAYKEDSY